MARSYGHIMSAIWNDPEFRALDGASQRAYLMLVTQSEITSAGTLALTIKRWSQYASNTPPDAISDSLFRLESKRFIALDEDTEELVVRSFVKWDGGANNPKRIPAISAAANAVVSPKVRAVLAAELTKLAVPHSILDSLCDTQSDRHPDTPRVVVTEVSIDHNPQPTTQTHNPGTVANSAPNKAPAKTELAVIDHATAPIIGRWIDHCAHRPPSTIIKQVGKHVRALLDEGISPTHVERGLAQWAQRDLAPSVLPSFVNGAMNGKSNGHKQSTGTERAIQGLEVAAQLAERGM
jgi:hypothetical protein